MKRPIISIGMIGFISTFLLGCPIQPDPPPDPDIVFPACESFNKSDDVTPYLNSELLKFKVPVARFAEETRGTSVVFLPTTSAETTLFWVWQTPQNTWEIAQKQTVVRLMEPGSLDTQFIHRFDPQVFPKTILFITLPQRAWDKPLEIEPVLEPPEARWGKVDDYPVRITAQGMVHPFQGLVTLGDSGDSLPDHLNKIMNEVEPGSIYLPNKLGSQVRLRQPSLSNPELCPKAGQT